MDKYMESMYCTLYCTKYIHTLNQWREFDVGLPFCLANESQETSVEESCLKSKVSGSEITHFEYGQMF